MDWKHNKADVELIQTATQLLVDQALRIGELIAERDHWAEVAGEHLNRATDAEREVARLRAVNDSLQRQILDKIVDL